MAHDVGDAGTPAGARGGPGTGSPAGDGDQPDGSNLPGEVVTEFPDPVAVRVTRTGGFAGLRREWSLSAPPEDRPTVIALILACPWEDSVEPTAVAPPRSGADQFHWHIAVTTEAGSGAASAPPLREQALPESAVVGPWRALVEWVQSEPRETKT